MTLGNKWRKRPVVITALQWDGSPQSAEDIAAAFGRENFVISTGPPGPIAFACCTPEGVLMVTPGDFVIQGIQREVYPCKPDIFLATYEEVTP